jgi:hypothetical protein
MKIIPCILLLAGPLLAQETPHAEKAAAASAIPDVDKSVLFIEPKGRASDYIQAFELLRKDKPSIKISLRTMGGATLTISELTSSSNGTLLFAKVPSNSGSKYLIVPIEEILEIAYSPN